MNDVAGRPHLKQIKGPANLAVVEITHPAAGDYYLYAEKPDDLLFTENETNFARIDNSPANNPFVKDAFHRYLVNSEKDAVHPDREGTKVAALFDGDIDAGQTRTIRLRLTDTRHNKPFAKFDAIFSNRQAEADEFYKVIHSHAEADHRQLSGQKHPSWMRSSTISPGAFWQAHPACASTVGEKSFTYLRSSNGMERISSNGFYR
jgi:hypothetical protein